MAPKARTLLHTYFLIISMHSICQEIIFSVANNGEMRGGGFILDYVPLWAPRQFDWTKLAYFTSRSCIQQNKTSIKPLRHTLRKCVWTSPLVGPQGSGLGQNCTCTTRPWGHQNVTIIDRYLQYLITEEIKGQYIVYVRTAGRPDDERVWHKLVWSSTSRAKNCIHSNSTLILQKTHIFAFSCPPSKTVCVKS